MFPHVNRYCFYNIIFMVPLYPTHRYNNIKSRNHSSNLEVLSHSKTYSRRFSDPHFTCEHTEPHRNSVEFDFDHIAIKRQSWDWNSCGLDPGQHP